MRVLVCSSPLMPAIPWALLLLASAGVARADDAAAEDPTLIVARTVHPRSAYRSLPAADNPVKTQAALFPARAFRAAVDHTPVELLGDEALDARGSMGIASSATASGRLRLDGTPAATAVGWAAPRSGASGAAMVSNVPLGVSIQHGAGAPGALSAHIARATFVPTLPGGGP